MEGTGEGWDKAEEESWDPTLVLSLKSSSGGMVTSSVRPWVGTIPGGRAMCHIELISSSVASRERKEVKVCCYPESSFNISDMRSCEIIDPKKLETMI